MQTNAGAKPLFGYSGSKVNTIPNINIYMDYGIRNRDCDVYIEPFVGSLSVFINVYENYGEKLNRFFISDYNKNMTILYNVVRYNHNQLVDETYQLLKSTAHLVSAPQEEHKKFYYLERNRMNSIGLKLNEMSSVGELTKFAALFMMVNSNCFNDVQRYNSKGEFNTSSSDKWHLHFHDPDNIEALHEILADDRIAPIQQVSYQHYRDVVLKSNRNFMYFDPPYHPKNTNSVANVKYTPVNFGHNEQVELAEFCKSLIDHGKILINNSDDVDYFKSLYGDRFNYMILHSYKNLKNMKNAKSIYSDLFISNMEIL